MVSILPLLKLDVADVRFSAIVDQMFAKDLLSQPEVIIRSILCYGSISEA